MKRTINVDYLARVEGEGAMYLEIEGDQVKDLQFSIFEPPRFFEAFMRGRHFTEAPDLTARICGICPIAYQMSSVAAMENAVGATVDGQLQELRRLIYCGEWIESHVLHVYMLHSPDFLGYQSAIHMAADYPEIVERGLRMKKIGNGIVTLLGGREIHPINVKVGGFYRTPTNAEVDAMIPDLEWAYEAAIETARWVGRFDFPEFDRPYEFVSTAHPTDYPFMGDRVVSDRGIDIPVHEWNDVFEELHVERSNALHARIKARGAYHVGPMARYSLNFDKLPDDLQALGAELGIANECRNPYKSIIVRSIEVALAYLLALEIIDRYEPPTSPAVPIEAMAAEGHGVSEAPRGLLYHRYVVDAEGMITDAQITPPTSQNQLSIEEDLMAYVPGRTHLDDETLQWQLEQAIRAYDPCISCATHFLDLTVKRS
ncbi:MAG: nickel-dependent hydrogenase large subunit [Acidimicrobiia bacterium]|nr:nickel-dependent hydrogenase large subunit [Acidimicrobiia bacterium]NNL28700.1 Ni/Fe hydrogenase subunit alpha [Acidimicrobiia bacterium]